MNRMRNLLLTLTTVFLSTSIYADKPLNLQSSYSMPKLENNEDVTNVQSGELSRNSSNSRWSNIQPVSTSSSFYVQYTQQKGKFENDIDADLKGGTIGYSTSPDLSGWWAELEYLKNSEYSADYYEATLGGQYNIFNANGLYLLGSIGMGIGVGSAEGLDDTAYLTLPIGLELGYSFVPNLSVYGGLGYKWNWEITNKNDDEYGVGKTLCKDGTWSNSSGSGTCSHHGGIAQSVNYYSDKNTIGDFNGMTYKVGLRYNF